ncbi:hypothetical protein [Nocardia asteroides]|uniref:hypothetical protein n=1 Tax=Nocardia asteroides TaxID=1824 RepID=UPI0033E78DB4
MTNIVRNLRSGRQAGSAPGPVTAFARFVACGGGLGLASSLAVAQLGGLLPWVLANAVVTIVSTLLGTVAHALITFGGHTLPGWREHLQSAGSAAVAYAATSVAMLALFSIEPAPDALTEQIVYLSASALAGLGRFLVLRMVVFAPTKIGSGDTADSALAPPSPVSIRWTLGARKRDQGTPDNASGSPQQTLTTRPRAQADVRSTTARFALAPWLPVAV